MSTTGSRGRWYKDELHRLTHASGDGGGALTLSLSQRERGRSSGFVDIVAQDRGDRGFGIAEVRQERIGMLGREVGERVGAAGDGDGAGAGGAGAGDVTRGVADDGHLVGRE